MRCQRCYLFFCAQHLWWRVYASRASRQGGWLALISWCTISLHPIFDCVYAPIRVGER